LRYTYTLFKSVAEIYSQFWSPDNAVALPQLEELSLAVIVWYKSIWFCNAVVINW
jgi:hypothetical protein